MDFDCDTGRSVVWQQSMEPLRRREARLNSSEKSEALFLTIISVLQRRGVSVGRDDLSGVTDSKIE